MAISHLCISCGHDLTWIRAVPDPRYGLALVVCPQCRSACTRTTPEIIPAIRNTKRTIRSVVVLISQLLMLAIMVFATLGTLYWLAGLTQTPAEILSAMKYELGHEGGLGFEDPWEFRTPIIVLGSLSAGIGAWVCGSYGHLRIRGVFGLWIGLILFWHLFFFFGRAIDAGLHNGHAFPRHRINEFVSAGVYFLMSLLFFTIGMPIGHRFRKIWVGQRSNRISKYRSKRRKHRMNNAKLAQR